MSRKKETEKHPAVALKLRRQLADSDRAELESIRGWNAFTKDEKAFLLLHPYYGSQRETSRFLGHDQDWVFARREKNAYFNEAVQYRSESVSRLFRSYMVDLLGVSAIRLGEMLGSDKDTKTQLDAIKIIHKAIGVGHSDSGADARQGQYINTQNILMIDDSEQAKELMGAQD